MSVHFIVRHELVPDQVGQCVFVVSDKNIIKTERAHQGEVHVQESSHVNAMCTSGIFVVVDTIYKQVFIIQLYVALYTFIIRIPSSDGRFVFLVFLVLGIHRFEVAAVFADIVLGILLYNFFRLFADVFITEAGRNEIRIQTIFQHIIR